MKRLISLVNKIMDYEKFESENLKLELKIKNISDIIKEIVETHKKRLKENKQRVKIVWDENLEIELDTNLFKQVIHNLVWNFLKYAWKKTILKINITRNYIEFNDDWAWIKANEVQFLTEKFYQWSIEKSWDIETRGMWIWLSLVQKIIESHWWKSELRSETGKWFSFKIKL